MKQKLSKSIGIDIKEIEQIESRYLDELEWNLSNEKGKIVKLLQTKDEIKDDWIDKFDRLDKKKQTGVLARGSERVLGTFFPNTWLANSSPIGSDFMFETFDAVIHIDIKTSTIKNSADHHGKVPLSKNQTSYPVNGEKKFVANLPTFYKKNGVKKVCVTYIIQIVYDDKISEIACVVLICVPNGELYDVCGGDEIMDAGKTKGQSVRYRYGNQTFRFNHKNKRYRIIHSDSDELEKRITTLAH